MKHLIKISILTAIFGIAMFSCNGKDEEKTLVSIEITSQPTKKTYTVGEPFDAAGMVVTATFSDGSKETITITQGMITFSSQTAGTNISATITYVYEGKTVTATVTGITVNAPKTLSSIAVTSQPTKKEYTVGDTFDAAGMVVTATYSDNSTSPVAVTAAMLTYDFKTAGAKTVTITYEGKTATVTGITVGEPKTVESIAITSPPTKKTYALNEAFDPAGMVVTATYSDNSTAPVAVTAAMLSYNFEAVGAATVTVTYEGKTAEVTGITVYDPTGPATLVDVAVKSVAWGTPTVVRTPPTAWGPTAYATATWTGVSAVLTLSFSNSTAKDTTVTDLSFTSVAKYESRGITNDAGLIYVSYVVEHTPRPWTGLSETTTATTHTETGRFNFAQGELYLEYSITNSLASVLIRGEQVAVLLGKGAVVNTFVNQTYVSSIIYEGKMHARYNVVHRIEFQHPGNLKREFPSHSTQVGEVRED